MKRILIVLPIVLLMLTTLVCAEGEDFFVVKPLSEPSESGYVEYGTFDADGNPVEPVKRKKSAQLFSDPLPGKYDSRELGYVTSIKNQGAYGTCWAHAFVACAEANMIKKGFEKDFINYSELHAAYFCNKRNEEQGDGADKFDSQCGYFGVGNSQTLAQCVENYQGLAVESDFNYEQVSKSADFSLSEEDRYISDVRLKHYGKIETAEDAKKAVMEYGAATCAFYHDLRYLSSNGAYYQNIYDYTNHEVTIVGWDDDYSRLNFPESLRPDGDGAWLVKNSHGIDSGDFGYIWISYEDSSLNLGSFYDFEPVGDENKVHSHNGADVAGVWWNIPAANVFYAEENQTLTSVGFEAVTGSVCPEKYEIKIYTFSSKPTSPEKGTAKATLTGNIPYDGFWKINLTRPLTLKKGQYFSVVLRLKDSAGKSAPIVFEQGDNYSSENGESYFYKSKTWNDANNYEVSGYVIKNAAIKAYAVTETVHISFSTHGHGKPETQTVAKGGYITKPEDPSYLGYDFLGWYTDYTCIHEWDFSQPVQHDMVLYGKWSAPEHVKLNTRSKFFSWCYSPSYRVSADHAENYILYFMKDGKIIGRTGKCGESDFEKWYSYGSEPDGKYECFAEIFGANGEYIKTDRVPYEVTHDTKLSVDEGYITIVNLPPEGVDLYIAQYSDDGRLLSVTKTKCDIESSDIKLFNCPENLKNPKFFLWARDEITPVCESDKAQ